MKLYIGIDGGGSNTRAWLGTADGKVIGIGKGGPSNYHYAGSTVTAASIHSAVNEAFSAAGLNPVEVEAACLGLASVKVERDVPALTHLVRSTGCCRAKYIFIRNDTYIALRGGLAGGPGITLIAGTGSACFGINTRNETFQCGGQGFLADDAGSGWWIARKAVEMTARQMDGRCTRSRLLPAVFEFLKITDPVDFARTLQNFSRPELACLAPIVIDLANEGDPAAAVIFQEAVNNLAELVAVTAKSLGLTQPLLILTGSIANAPSVREPLYQQLRQVLPGLQICKPELPPPGGALQEAIRCAAQVSQTCN